MAEQKESTKAKSTVVTSPITTSRHPSIASQNMQDGAKLPTEAKEREEVLNQLARMIDVMHNWPMKIDGKMPKSQRDFYNEMKKIYAIPISQELLHKDDELIEALKNGGDISGIIKR